MIFSPNYDVSEIAGSRKMSKSGASVSVIINAGNVYGFVGELMSIHAACPFYTGFYIDDFSITGIGDANTVQDGQGYKYEYCKVELSYKEPESQAISEPSPDTYKYGLFYNANLYPTAPIYGKLTITSEAKQTTQTISDKQATTLMRVPYDTSINAFNISQARPQLGARVISRTVGLMRFSYTLSNTYTPDWCIPHSLCLISSDYMLPLVNKTLPVGTALYQYKTSTEQDNSPTYSFDVLYNPDGFATLYDYGGFDIPGQGVVKYVLTGSAGGSHQSDGVIKYPYDFYGVPTYYSV